MSATRETKTAIAKRLSEAIHAHLKRFESDPKINRRNDGATRFYIAGSWGDRHRVGVRYVSYQGVSHLSVEEAARYLAWLDAGNVGTHHVALRAST